MNVILATFGTDGDVFPFIGLGRELIKRGHTVSLVTSGTYQAAARENGFKYHELFSREESEKVLGDPDFWHPLKAGPLAARWGVRFLRQQYALMAELVKEEGSIIVANPGVLAAPLVHDSHGTPFVSVILQPWIIPSVDNPAAMPGGLTLPPWAPRWAWKIYFWLLNRAAHYLIGGEVNALRKDIGLTRVERIFEWWISPQRVIGLFPAWFGAPQADWPSQIRLLTFPTFDGSDAPLPSEVESFLNAGDRPVAITFGTGIRHAARLYEAASKACARVGQRAIIVTKYPEQLPHPLPAGVVAVKYCPFSKLFPRCAAVMHHGGIGTTAKAFAARTPQLIVPICFDQLDNARRVQKLGCGLLVPYRKATIEKLALKLQSTLGIRITNLDVQASDGSQTFKHAADLVEETFNLAHARTVHRTDSKPQVSNALP